MYTMTHNCEVLNDDLDAYPKEVTKIVGTGRQDDFVRFDELALTWYGDIYKILIYFEVTKGSYDVTLEIIPLEAKVFVWHLFSAN